MINGSTYISFFEYVSCVLFTEEYLSHYDFTRMRQLEYETKHFADWTEKKSQRVDVTVTVLSSNVIVSRGS